MRTFSTTKRETRIIEMLVKLILRFYSCDLFTRALTSLPIIPFHVTRSDSFKLIGKKIFFNSSFQPPLHCAACLLSSLNEEKFIVVSLGINLMRCWNFEISLRQSQDSSFKYAADSTTLLPTTRANGNGKFYLTSFFHTFYDLVSASEEFFPRILRQFSLIHPSHIELL